MSEATSQSTGMAPQSPDTAAAPVIEDLPVTQADILAAESYTDQVLAGAVGEETSASAEVAATPVEGGRQTEPERFAAGRGCSRSQCDRPSLSASRQQFTIRRCKASRQFHLRTRCSRRSVCISRAS